MTNTITFNVTTDKNQTQKFTFQTTDSKLINSIITVKDNNTITKADMQKLQAVAQQAGDAGILEIEDLNGDEKLKLANSNKYSDQYEITLSADKKYFQVKVKDSWKNPLLSDIKADFGLKDGVLVTKDGIPHGNENLIDKRFKTSDVYAGNNADYDRVKLQAGDTINIPVSQITSLNGPWGFWGRLLKP